MKLKSTVGETYLRFIYNFKVKRSLFVCLSTASGGVYTWGHNGDGQLGTDSLEDQHNPVLIMELDIPIASLAAGSTHTAVLTGECYFCLF